MVYPAGKWEIDPTHSEVGFSVKHLMISKVKGSFGSFSGEIVTTENPLETTVEGSVDVTSINTNDKNRDNHLRSADFFDTENFPYMHFKSTKIEHVKDEKYILTGELTIKGVTKEIKLDTTFNGIAVDPYGQTKAAVEATGKINRTDFGLKWNQVLDNGAGLLVSEEVNLILEAQAVLQK